KVPSSGTCAVERPLYRLGPLAASVIGPVGGENMSLGEQVAEHLPYLRRFARAVTGSQKSGDAYVVSAVEAMLAGPSGVPRELPPRVALYRTFLKILNSIPLNCEGGEWPPHPGLEAIRRNLNSLAPRARQAFLLVSVEEFSPQDAALIL